MSHNSCIYVEKQDNTRVFDSVYTGDMSLIYNEIASKTQESNNQPTNQPTNQSSSEAPAPPKNNTVVVIEFDFHHRSCQSIDHVPVIYNGREYKGNLTSQNGTTTFTYSLNTDTILDGYYRHIRPIPLVLLRTHDCSCQLPFEVKIEGFELEKSPTDNAERTYTQEDFKVSEHVFDGKDLQRAIKYDLATCVPFVSLVKNMLETQELDIKYAPQVKVSIKWNSKKQEIHIFEFPSETPPRPEEARIQSISGVSEMSMAFSYLRLDPESTDSESTADNDPTVSKNEITGLHPRFIPDKGSKLDMEDSDVCIIFPVHHRIYFAKILKRELLNNVRDKNRSRVDNLIDELYDQKALQTIKTFILNDIYPYLLSYRILKRPIASRVQFKDNLFGIKKDLRIGTQDFKKGCEEEIKKKLKTREDKTIQIPTPDVLISKLRCISTHDFDYMIAASFMSTMINLSNGDAQIAISRALSACDAVESIVTWRIAQIRYNYASSAPATGLDLSVYDIFFLSVQGTDAHRLLRANQAWIDLEHAYFEENNNERFNFENAEKWNMYTEGIYIRRMCNEVRSLANELTTGALEITKATKATRATRATQATQSNTTANSNSDQDHYYLKGTVFIKLAQPALAPFALRLEPPLSCQLSVLTDGLRTIDIGLEQRLALAIKPEEEIKTKHHILKIPYCHNITTHCALKRFNSYSYAISDLSIQSLEMLPLHNDKNETLYINTQSSIEFDAASIAWNCFKHDVCNPKQRRLVLDDKSLDDQSVHNSFLDRIGRSVQLFNMCYMIVMQIKPTKAIELEKPNDVKNTWRSNCVYMHSPDAIEYNCQEDMHPVVRQRLSSASNVFDIEVDTSHLKYRMSLLRMRPNKNNDPQTDIRNAMSMMWNVERHIQLLKILHALNM